MRIFLRTLLILPIYFLSLLSSLLQAVITNNPDNHSDLLMIILDMCNAHKLLLPQLNYSKKTLLDNTFYKGSGIEARNKFYPITNIQNAL